MATAKKSQPKPKKSKTVAVQPQTSKRLIWILVSVGILLVALAVWWFAAGSNASTTRAIRNYLHDKYGQEFVVENLRTEGASLGMPGQKTADAYNAKDPSLKFETGKFPEGQYFDDYMRALWSREAYNDAQQAVQATFGNRMPRMKMNVYPISLKNGREDRTSDAYAHMPTLESQLKQDNTVVFYKINVTETSPSFAEADVSTAIQRIKSLLEFVASKQTGAGGIRYAINLDNEDSRLICNISERPFRIPSDSELADCFINIRGRE